MDIGEAISYCLHGGKIRATKTYYDQSTASWLAWYDDEHGWVSRVDAPGSVMRYSGAFFVVSYTKRDLARWTFEPVNDEQLRREHLEYRLGLERDRLAHLERTRPPTDGLITVAKSTIIQLEAILKGAI